VDDTDASSTRLKRTHHARPDEGWEQWATGIIDIVSACATIEALERVQDRQRSFLKAISLERPDLYAAIGSAFAERSGALREAAPNISRADKRRASAGVPRARSARTAKSVSQRQKKSSSGSRRRAADEQPRDQGSAEASA